MRKKLMIVEKDRDILTVMSHIFEDEGYNVIPFSKEDGVLDEIIKERPDAILLDIMQPTEEGTVLCREIKATPGISQIPVIALSTHVHFNRIKDLCADKVLGKPFDVSNLLGAVESELA